jgi:hypothetical protein
MRKARRVGVFSLLASVLLVGSLAGPTSAASTAFGAKLTHTTQPSNAEGGQSCHQNVSVPKGTVCTWVAIEAAHNGSHFKAPKGGTIHTLRLISCIAGSFKLQIARANPSTHKAKVVRNGPKIVYNADTNPDGCGGEDGDQYIIQTFPIHVAVSTGDYIAVKAAKLGTLYCSGGDGVMLFSPPLAPGGSLRPQKGGASCDLLVRLEY